MKPAAALALILLLIPLPGQEPVFDALKVEATLVRMHAAMSHMRSLQDFDQVDFSPDDYFRTARAAAANESGAFPLVAINDDVVRVVDRFRRDAMAANRDATAFTVWESDLLGSLLSSNLLRAYGGRPDWEELYRRRLRLAGDILTGIAGCIEDRYDGITLVFSTDADVDGNTYDAATAARIRMQPMCKVARDSITTSLIGFVRACRTTGAGIDADAVRRDLAEAGLSPERIASACARMDSAD